MKQLLHVSSFPRTGKCSCIPSMTSVHGGLRRESIRAAPHEAWTPAYAGVTIITKESR